MSDKVKMFEDVLVSTSVLFGALFLLSGSSAGGTGSISHNQTLLSVIYQCLSSCWTQSWTEEYLPLDSHFSAFWNFNVFILIS